jgi:uncharacterized protein (TIGR02996 family)
VLKYDWKWDVLVTDSDTLFRAILENPDDDTLRLIYADAIQEEGDARRAVFIRCQVEFAHLPDYDPARLRAQYFEKEKLSGSWLLDYLPLLPDGLSWAAEPFRRGFPAALQVNRVPTFVAEADDLFARAPIEAVELAAPSLPESTLFAQCPWRNRLIKLSVVQGLGQHVARLLLGSTTHYERLKELHIGAGLSTDNTVSSIVRSPTFKQLTTLSWRDDRGDGRGGGRSLVNELIQLADPPQLKNLDLSGNRLRGDQLARLLAAPALALVEELDLSDNNLGGEAMQSLSRARLPQLRSLHLQRARAAESGIRTLCEAQLLSELRSLSLAENILSSAVGEILGTCPGMANLRVLDLHENRLGDLGTTALAESPHVRSLAHLDLSANQIEDAGAEALYDSPYLTGLIRLDLHGNIISTPVASRLKQRFGERVAV